MGEGARFDDLLRILGDLVEANDARPVVVEGRRDVEALRALGCRGDVVALHRGDGLHEVARALADRHEGVILLTDWDRKGDALFDALSSLLTAHGARVDRVFRDRLRRAVAPSVRDVEGVPGHVRRMFRRHPDRAPPEAAE